MADALSQNIGTAASLTSLLTTLFGGGGKEGGTTTQTETGGGQISSGSNYSQSGGYGYEQTLIDDVGIKRLLQQIMEGTGGTAGLTQLAQGEKTAGLYNTTTRQQMIDDLMARASGEVAVKGAKTEKVTPISRTGVSNSSAPNPTPRTVVTQTPNTKTTGILDPSILGLLGMGMFGMPLLKKGYNSIEEMLFGSGFNMAGADAAALATFNDSLSASVQAEWGDAANAISSKTLTDLGYPELNISGDISSAAGEIVNPYAISGDSLGGYMNYSAADANFLQAGANGNMFTAAELGTDLSDMIPSVSNIFTDGGATAASMSGLGDTTSDLVSSIVDPTSGAAAVFSDGGATADAMSGLGDTTLDITAGADAAGSFWDGGGAGPLAYLDSAGRLANGDVGGAATSAALTYFDPTGGWIAAADAITGGNLVNGFVEDVLDDILGIECFITTAVCGASGKADNCYELETLRKFRDTWLLENKPEDIKTYYDEAPGIVKAIQSRKNASEIFKSFDSDYIQPAIAAIEAGELDLAYKIYKDLFNTAKGIAQS